MWYTGIVGHVVDAVCDVSESLRAVVNAVECCHVGCEEQRGRRGNRRGNGSGEDDGGGGRLGRNWKGGGAVRERRGLKSKKCRMKLSSTKRLTHIYTHTNTLALTNRHTHLHANTYTHTVPSNACAVQMLLVALSLLMCCSLVCIAILNAGLPRESIDTPMIRPGILRELRYDFMRNVSGSMRMRMRMSMSMIMSRNKG